MINARKSSRTTDTASDSPVRSLESLSLGFMLLMRRHTVSIVHDALHDFPPIPFPLGAIVAAVLPAGEEW